VSRRTFDLAVSLRVFRHVVLPNESFPTDGADERFLPGMETEVTSEICFVVELLGTELTFVGFVVPVLGHVVRESRGLREPFPAGGTLEGFPSRVTTVGVLGQVAGAVKGFGAIGTLYHLSLPFSSGSGGRGGFGGK